MCDHTWYWCDDALSFSQRYSANYRHPKDTAELLRRVFAGEDTEDPPIEHDNPTTFPEDHEDTGPEDIFMPACSCYMWARVTITVPIWESW